MSRIEGPSMPCDANSCSAARTMANRASAVTGVVDRDVAPAEQLVHDVGVARRVVPVPRVEPGPRGRSGRSLIADNVLQTVGQRAPGGFAPGREWGRGEQGCYGPGPLSAREEGR